MPKVRHKEANEGSAPEWAAVMARYRDKMMRTEAPGKAEKARERFDELNGIRISVSLSHCKSYAVAYAIVEVEDKK